jgi:ComF family protein
MIDEPIAEKPGAFQRLTQVARSTWRNAVDVITPPLCLACQTPVTTGAALCTGCWQKLHFIDEPVCDVMGTPFAYDEGDGAVSPAALANSPAWDKARAAVVFDEVSQHLVHLLKYQDNHEVALAMARMMAGAGRNVLAETDVVVPVPLHRRRLWQRRFNQAALLAQHMARDKALPCLVDILERKTATSSQVGLDAQARRRNMRSAFSVSPEKRAMIEGKRVLLVDDVRTTGATAEACAATLHKAGAAQVFVLSFALVLTPTQLHIEG